MQQSTALIWSYLNILTKKRYDVLLQQYNSLDGALESLSPEMLRALGCKEETMMTALNRLDDLQNASDYEQELARRGITLISIEDAAYPTMLRTIPDPPIFLYYKGSLEILNQPCIGCVGRREMSEYGKRVVAEFIPAFVRAGMVTVSGLALGIDTEVARETLHAGGKTVAIVGHGLADIYPSSNRPLVKQIIESGGLILSEYPLDMPGDKYTFPARNRIIAGLSSGTIVLEAGEGSGSLITADLALEYGRDVFAVPGQIFDPGYAGSHRFISQAKAKLVSEPQEVLNDLGIVSFATEGKKTARTFNDAHEQALYTMLTTMPQSVSDLVERAQLDAAVITAKLTMLELSGAAKNTGNGLWVRL
ncbi:MAG: DNA-processing protein DprA [Candidatus Peregrinibacteria bacterium]|nr:DNA-processing protein DprA [Candidatus Peregrinibacteria bacterium]MCB9807706.1 DNA-protecting protein DprA [Candidatus Peribacteria bacterium]